MNAASFDRRRYAPARQARPSLCARVPSLHTIRKMLNAKPSL
jgi:hypothetical protein